MWEVPDDMQSDATVLLTNTHEYTELAEKQVLGSLPTIEDSLEWFDHIALAFLLYDDLQLAIDNITALLEAYQQNNKDLSWRRTILSPYLGGKTKISHALFEALFFLKQKKLLKNWDITITNIDHLDPCRVQLFKLIDNMTEEEAKEKIHQVYTAGMAVINKEQKTWCPELHFLQWIKEKVITEENLDSWIKFFQGVYKPQKPIAVLPPPPIQPPLKKFHIKRGLCVIINQMNFYIDVNLSPRLHRQTREGLDFRYGSDIDRDKLSETFRMLSHKVEIYENLNREQLLSTMEQISKYDFSAYDDLVLCLLSHGEHNVIFSSDSIPISLDEIKTYFDGNHCRQLIGKPKLFFVQACQGYEDQQPVYPDNIEADGVVQSCPAVRDFFQLHATVSGYQSYRSTTKGAIFITELCELLQSHGHQMSLVQLALMINCKVSDFVNRNKKQISEFTSCLTRDVQFQRDKTNMVDVLLDRLEREQMELAVRKATSEILKSCDSQLLPLLIGSPIPSLVM